MTGVQTCALPISPSAHIHWPHAGCGQPRGTPLQQLSGSREPRGASCPRDHLAGEKGADIRSRAWTDWDEGGDGNLGSTLRIQPGSWGLWRQPTEAGPRGLGGPWRAGPAGRGPGCQVPPPALPGVDVAARARRGLCSSHVCAHPLCQVICSSQCPCTPRNVCIPHLPGASGQRDLPSPHPAQCPGQRVN